MKARINALEPEEKPMKYILLMTGTKAGVEHYRTWAPKDIDTHMAGLGSLVLDLHQSGELVAEQGLTGPDEAMVVCGLKNGMPVTDGIFPESKEFLLGYWIVDVATPERAHAIAARLSSVPGPGGIPTNMPIEVRKLAYHPLNWS
jgi:hypothetical protein